MHREPPPQHQPQTGTMRKPSTTAAECSRLLSRRQVRAAGRYIPTARATIPAAAGLCVHERSPVALIARLASMSAVMPRSRACSVSWSLNQYLRGIPRSFQWEVRLTGSPRARAIWVCPPKASTTSAWVCMTDSLTTYRRIMQPQSVVSQRKIRKS